MKLFDAVPNDLFSVLASPNRELYSDALDVLYNAYRENLKIPENKLYIMLRSKLEQQLADATFEGEDIDEEELKDISGRARFLIRKLCSKGWFEKERGEDFDEYITVPGYSSRLLELFHQLRDDSPIRGYSYVFGTYSTLKVANEGNNIYDKMAAIYSAYDNTQALINLLQMVYHNVKHFFQIQIEMQEVNKVLASHFDDYGQKIAEAYIRPLKIKDSVPKYRGPIQVILNSWVEDDALLIAMANAAVQDKRGSTLEECRTDLLKKIFWVKERYDSIERDYLDEIDGQVRRYTRATTQKIENLTNRDHNVRGNLNYLLQELSRNHRASDLVEQIQPAFQLYEQSFLSEKSLWYRKRPGKRVKADPVPIEETSVDIAAEDSILLKKLDVKDYIYGEYGEPEPVPGIPDNVIIIGGKQIEEEGLDVYTEYYPLYIGTMADSFSYAAVAAYKEAEVIMVPMRSIGGDVVATVTYYAAVGSGSQNPELTYEFLRQFLLEESQWEQNRPQRKHTYPFKDTPDNDSNDLQYPGLIGNGWPVRDQNTVETLWEVRRKQIYVKQLDYFFTSDGTRLRMRKIGLSGMTEAQIPLFDTPINQVRFNTTLSEELAQTLTSLTDPAPTAERLCWNLRWHVSEG